MVFIFGKSTVFSARYLIVLHYHKVFYFFDFLIFSTIRKQNVGKAYVVGARVGESEVYG